MIESPINSDYVLAKISQDFWIYVGVKQAGRSEGLDSLLTEAKKEPRPPLLSCDSEEPLYFGPAQDGGKVIYAGASKADFLCRLRLLENTDYHWEILHATKTGPTVITENRLPAADSSLRDAKRIGIRWEADERQAKGILSFGNFLGSAWIGLKDGPRLRFEVISAKLAYEEQYLALLRDLTEKSLALLFDPEAPTQGKLIETDGEQKTPLEKFMLLQASLPLNEVRAAMGMIRARPHSQLESDERWLPAGMATGVHAMADPTGRIRWVMNRYGKPVPTEVLERKRRDTTDTAPNRFIKLAIQQFMDACRAIKDDPKQYGQRLSGLASELHTEFEQQSRAEVISSAGLLGRIPLENQVLQKREGYRHFLRSWIVSNKTISIKDIDRSGVLSPTAENRQVPDLYEYWLFFFLAEALEEMPGATEPDRRYVKELNPDGTATITLTKSDAPRLTLKTGKGETARFVALYYNRPFTRGPGHTSYSLTLRPDYTVETFPVIYGSSFEQCHSSAEKLGEITYIHFDAKFRIANLDLKRAGDYEGPDAITHDDAKPEDVYKMHTYNEAIRGTAASVILFPGGQEADGRLNQSFVKYRELIPGVGALAISPGNHEVRSKALKAIRDYLSKALLLTPKSKSSYARMRDWELNELRDQEG